MRRALSCLFLITFLSAAPIYADPAEPRVKQDPKPAESQPRPKNTSPTDFNLTTYGGSGLILAVSPYTLEPGQLAAGGDVMNFDRNPGDIDFFEFSFQRIPGKTDSRSTSSTASNTCLQAKKAAVSTPASIRASSNSAPACFDGDPHTWKQMRSCE